jgi:hypothetical protein
MAIKCSMTSRWCTEEKNNQTNIRDFSGRYNSVPAQQPVKICIHRDQDSASAITFWSSIAVLTIPAFHHGNHRHRHVPWCQRKAQLSDTSPWSPIGRKLRKYTTRSHHTIGLVDIWQSLKTTNVEKKSFTTRSRMICRRQLGEFGG